MNGWQPIETAPKDGSWVLLWYEEFRRPAVGKWYAPGGFSDHWCIEGRLTMAIDPTYWMPLPGLPKQPKQQK